MFNENEQRYGYRRITDELHAKGILINHKKVLRLMKMLGIRGKKRKNEEYHSYKGEVGKVADNLLNRDFNAERAFEKLATRPCANKGNAGRVEQEAAERRNAYTTLRPRLAIPTHGIPKVS